MSTDRARQAAGQPTGGQFAATAGTDAGLSLSVDSLHSTLMEHGESRPMLLTPDEGDDYDTKAGNAMVEVLAKAGVSMRAHRLDDGDDGTHRYTISVDLPGGEHTVQFPWFNGGAQYHHRTPSASAFMSTEMVDARMVEEHGNHYNFGSALGYSFDPEWNEDTGDYDGPSQAQSAWDGAKNNADWFRETFDEEWADLVEACGKVEDEQ